MPRRHVVLGACRYRPSSSASLAPSSRSGTNRAVRRPRVRTRVLHRGFRDATVHRGLHHPSSRRERRAPDAVAVVHTSTALARAPSDPAAPGLRPRGNYSQTYLPSAPTPARAPRSTRITRRADAGARGHQGPGYTCSTGGARDGMSSTETATVRPREEGRRGDPRDLHERPRQRTSARPCGRRTRLPGVLAESITRIHQTGNLLARHRDGDAEGCGCRRGWRR